MPEPADSVRAWIAIPFAFVASLAAFAPAPAQTIHGQLVEKGTNAPVPGAFVVLLDESDQQRDAALTDAAGRFLLAAPGQGEYTLGLDRIGYFSTRTDPIALSEDQVIRYRLETIVAPVALHDIVVALESECRIRPEEGQTVTRVWEEARKALNATAFTQQMGLLRSTVVARERVLDPFSFAVREESERRRSGVTHGSPYVALPPSILTRSGYARFGEEEQVYYGPDANTLLSDDFLDTHCFRLREPPPEEPHSIGVWFEPVRDHRLPDIRGTLWIDERTAELDRLEYNYTNLPPAVERRGAGGEIDFERLPTGEWIIREWRIRMPVIRIPDDRMYSHLTMDPDERVATVVRIKEDSGEVIEIAPARAGAGARRLWAEAIDWRPQFAAIEAGEALRASMSGGICPVGSVAPGQAAMVGTVRDSSSGTTLPGARVTVAWEGGAARAAERTTMTDIDGRYVICGVLVGEPLELAAIFPGRSMETVATVPEDVERHVLDLELVGDAAIESPRVRSAVAVRRDAGTEGGVVAGTVRDAASGEPLAGAQVALPDAGVGAVTEDDGTFRVSDVRAGRQELRIESLGYESVTARVEVGPEGRANVEALLVPTAIAVAALEVTVPSHAAAARRSRGFAGWRLASDDIPESFTGSIPELLDRRFAGVTYARSRLSACPVIMVRRERISLVVLDGQPFRDTCVLEHLLPQDLASIEVLPGLAGGIAVGRAGGAGAIVIETRHGDR